MRSCLLLALLAAFSVSSLATDVGMPLFSTTVGKSASLEVYYERFNRDIEQVYLSGTDTGEQEEDRFLARVSFHPGTKASLYLEAGATESEDSEGAVPIFGAGLKVKVYDRPALQVSAFASGTYIDEIEYKQDGYVDYDVPGYTYVDYPDYEQKESYVEINGGLIISRDIAMDEATHCIPYGGFMVSMLDGDEDYKLTYHVDEPAREYSGDIQDDGLFALIAGLGVTLDNVWAIRFEGRFVNQESFSAGLSYMF
jgi:hypothetical protein